MNAIMGHTRTPSAEAHPENGSAKNRRTRRPRRRHVALFAGTLAAVAVIAPTAQAQAAAPVGCWNRVNGTWVTVTCPDLVISPNCWNSVPVTNSNPLGLKKVTCPDLMAF